MSDIEFPDLRKHVTLRYIPTVPMTWSEEEGAYGTVLTALPDTAQVVVHDVFQVGQQYLAQVSIVTEEYITEEELANLLAEADQATSEDLVPPPAEDNVTPIAKPRRKRSGPPPTAG